MQTLGPQLADRNNKWNDQKGYPLGYRKGLCLNSEGRGCGHKDIAESSITQST